MARRLILTGKVMDVESEIGFEHGAKVVEIAYSPGEEFGISRHRSYVSKISIQRSYVNEVGYRIQQGMSEMQRTTKGL